MEDVAVTLWLCLAVCTRGRITLYVVHDGERAEADTPLTPTTQRTPRGRSAPPGARSCTGDS